MRITDGRGVDWIVEVDFAANLETSLKILKVNGAVAAYASTRNRTPVVSFYDLMRRDVTVQAFVLSTLPEARRQAQQDITRRLEAGARLDATAGRFPLEDGRAPTRRSKPGPSSAWASSSAGRKVPCTRPFDPGA